jgi:SAM-dependent MidA family methyltransferase
MQSGKPVPVPNGFIEVLQEAAGEGTAGVGLDRFIECALYHPEHGYYTRQRKRVGRHPETDFYTASSLGPVFARLVMGAINSLLRTPLSGFTFIEIGPENGEGIIQHLDSVPFHSCTVIRPDDPIEIPPKSIVFSNEVLDAQPFRRFVHKNGEWLETVVQFGKGTLSLALQPPLQSLPDLPESAPDGYTIDWPSGAHALLKSISGKPWNGLFIAFDYGLERTTVYSDRPEGTGRTYSAHTMGSNLLENPGQRDITCHLIWEECQDILVQSGFAGVELQRQEAFFMHHATEVLNSIVAATSPGFSREKQTLMELLHPDNMGHKFQVLHARRGEF